MSEPSFLVRQLHSRDADIFHSIRLESLQQSPNDFGSTFEKESNQPYTSFREHFDKSTLFGGFVQESLLGIVGFFALEGPKQSHKGVLWGMYVRPEVRGTGLATALVESLIDHARERVEQIQLTVVASNPRARRFYQRMDFFEYGFEKNALKHNGLYFDEVLMVRFLH